MVVGGVKTALAELGYPQTEASERVAVRLPTEAEADALEMSLERNVLDIVHLGKTADGRIVVEGTTTVTPAHYFVIENTFALA